MPHPYIADSGASPPASVPRPVAVSVAGAGALGDQSPLPLPIGSAGCGHSSSPDKGSSAVSAPSRPPRAGGGPAAGIFAPAFGPKLAHRNGNGSGSYTNPDSGQAAGQSQNVGADPEWGPYLADLQRRIRKCWDPPRGPETKRVKVIFTVLATGEMTNLRLLQSSTLNISDQAALKAVENAAPFRHLPEGAPTSVDIEFTFDYNVFSGGSIR